MTFHRFLTSVLALAAAVVPVSASTVYCASACGVNDPTAFINATSALFFPNAAITFAPSGITNPSVDDSTYFDSASGVTFLSYNSSGTALDISSLSVVGTTLKAYNAGNLIDIILPAGVLAFSAHITQPSGSSSFCMESQVSAFTPNTCDNLLPVPATGSEFIAVVSSIPISNIWIGPNTGSPALQFNDFEIGQAGAISDTPEIATFLMIGIGLISLRFLPRKLRPAV